MTNPQMELAVTNAIMNGIQKANNQVGLGGGRSVSYSCLSLVSEILFYEYTM